MHMHKAIFLSHFYTRLKLNSQPHSLMCKYNMFMIAMIIAVFMGFVPIKTSARIEKLRK